MQEIKNQITEANLKILKIFSERKELIKKLTVEKVSSSSTLFDIDYEFQTFKELKNELNDLENRELYLFSMILENHEKNAFPAYPVWSEGEHLGEQKERWFCFTNPFLVYHVKPELFSEIPFNDTWRERIDRAIEVGR